MSTRNDFNPALLASSEQHACIGMLELGSVARGIEVADAVLWEAHVELLFSTPVQPGKYALLFSGSVQDVSTALRRGVELAGSDLVHQLHIPQLHHQVIPALERKGGHIDGALDALGIIETTSIASAIIAADQALKTAAVDLFDLRIANGLGGRSFLALTGEVSDVRSAIVAGARSASESGHLAREVVIPRPHADLSRHL